MRRFPAPWTVEALDGGFKVLDATGQSLAYVYGHADPRDAGIAKALTLDEARRIASNIAKLPALSILEQALIAHALTEDFELLQKQGTKTPNHTISFQGNRTSQDLAPRRMRVAAQA